MAVKISHASIDENGKATGGAAGDQTGKEVCIRTWYGGSWDVVLRPKKTTIAEKSAKFMEDACANDKIGYDQGQRNTLYANAVAVKFDASKIIVKCECDCSSLIHVAVIAAGANVTYGSNGFTTRTMVDRLVASGDYDKLTDSKYLTSDKYLKRGDILVKAGSHTVMVLEDGDGIAIVTPTVSNITSSASIIKTGDIVSITKDATYYNSTRRPGSWILNKTWIVKSVIGNRAVIDKSEDGKSSINSPIDTKYLTVVNKSTTSNTVTIAPMNPVADTTSYGKTQFIKDVQSAIGAKVDGIAGNETLSKTITISRSKNNRHTVVKAVQKYLNALGYNCGTVDGIAGAMFDAAIKKYQKDNGCVSDGEITAKNTTWKKLLGLA